MRARRTTRAADAACGARKDLSPGLSSSDRGRACVQAAPWKRRRRPRPGRVRESWLVVVRRDNGQKDTVPSGLTMVYSMPEPEAREVQMTNHLTLLSNGYSAGYLPRKARTRGNKHHCRARHSVPDCLDRRCTHIAGVLTSSSPALASGGGDGCNPGRTSNYIHWYWAGDVSSSRSSYGGGHRRHTGIFSVRLQFE